jgi:hypothetical protein
MHKNHKTKIFAKKQIKMLAYIIIPGIIPTMGATKRPTPTGGE